MKKKYLTTALLLFSFLIYSQETIPVSGGNANGNGSVAYTIGQMLITTNTGSNGSVSEGIQQSIELFTLTNPELKTLHLKAVTFPNPTKDKIILSLTNNVLKELSYSVFDINGRLVEKGIVERENTTIAMKKFATGIYFLKVHQNKKQLKTFKIIKN